MVALTSDGTIPVTLRDLFREICKNFPKLIHAVKMIIVRLSSRLRNLLRELYVQINIFAKEIEIQGLATLPVIG